MALAETDDKTQLLAFILANVPVVWLDERMTPLVPIPLGAADQAATIFVAPGVIALLVWVDILW